MSIHIETLIVAPGSVFNFHSSEAFQTFDEPSQPEPEDIGTIDTSFFCVNRFTAEVIEKNIRQVIDLASSKADACRRIMALEVQGYILLSNVRDDRKAELINPFSYPKYHFTGEDFKKSRNRYSG